MKISKLLIGITGKSCAGKDFVCTILKNWGYNELNLDKIGHKALQQKQEIVLQTFPEITNAQKNIDRKKLADLVFRKKAALHKLEAILHPYMRELVLEELNKLVYTNYIVSGEHTVDYSSSDYKLILNAAVLEKLGLLPLCELVLWVEAPLWIRAWRAQNRDNIGFYKFLYRNWAQRNLKKPFQHNNIYCITNNKIRPQNAQSDILQQLIRVPQLALEVR